MNALARLVQVLDDELAEFYRSLLKSEARHFLLYLNQAEKIAGGDSYPGSHRSCFLRQTSALSLTPDPDFRFHSGVPAILS